MVKTAYLRHLIVAFSFIYSFFAFSSPILGMSEMPKPKPIRITELVLPAFKHPKSPVCLSAKRDFGRFVPIPAIEKYVVNRAEEVERGYKAANLCFLYKNIFQNEALQKQLHRTGYSVVIPKFISLTSPEAQELLYIDLEQHALSKSPSIEDFHDLVQLGEDLRHCITRQQEIVSRASRCPSPREVVLRKFIHEAHTIGSRLMVRSSGIQEDTDENALAGANDTVVNVPADIEEIRKAVAQVMKSYFDFKSLSQQGLTSPATPRSPSPRFQTPVIIQHMIGEKLNGATDARDIPVGCVVFTQEPYAKTPGVMLIQGTFGHNAGVVDNSVPTDSFFVDSENCINSVIKHKPQRLIPIESTAGHALTFAPNPIELQHAPILQEEDIRAIGLVAREIERQYGKAMDIELVFMPSTKTIHLVQARPLTLQTELSPQYLQNIDKIAADNILECTTLNPNDSSVQHITSKSQLIIAQSLDEALMYFLKMPQVAQEAVKGVIVQTNASATSHAAITLRCARKFIMLTPDITKLNSWLSAHQISLFADTQQGKIANISAVMAIIADGWFKHPIPTCLSLIPFSSSATTPVHLYPESIYGFSVDQLFKMLKTSEDQSDCNRYLDSILAQIHARTQELEAARTNPQHKVFAHIDIDDWFRMYAHVHKAAILLKQKLGLNPQNLERLYATNFLEATLFQKPTATCVYCDSYESLNQRYGAQCGFITQTLAPLHPDGLSEQLYSDHRLFSYARLGANAALTEELAVSWIRFIEAIAKTPERETLHFVMAALAQYGTLSTFINIIFNRMHATTTPEEMIAMVGNELQSATPFLTMLQKINHNLDTYPIAAWTQPKQFKELSQLFRQHFIDFFMHDDLARLFSFSQTPLIQCFALEVMHKFVDVFDRIIKTIKSSTVYEDTSKIINISSMVSDFFALLRQWSIIIPTNALAYNPDWPLKRYLDKLDETIATMKRKPISADQLLPTASFSVANAALGSATYFDYCLPKSWEDVYTTIHQSLLVILGAQATQHFTASSLSLPLLLDSLHKTISQLKRAGGIRTAQAIGIRNTEQTMLIRYNLPIANHGIVFEVEYEKPTQQTNVTIRFVGEIQNGRWAHIAHFMRAWAAINHLPDPIVVLGDKEICATAKISAATEAIWQLNRIFTAMINFADDENPTHFIQLLLAVIRSMPTEKQLEALAALQQIPPTTIFWGALYLTCAQQQEMHHLLEPIKTLAGMALFAPCINRFYADDMMRKSGIANFSTKLKALLMAPENRKAHLKLARNVASAPEAYQSGGLALYQAYVEQDDERVYSQAAKTTLAVLARGQATDANLIAQTIIEQLLHKKNLPATILHEIKQFAVHTLTSASSPEGYRAGLNLCRHIINQSEFDRTLCNAIIYFAQVRLITTNTQLCQTLFGETLPLLLDKGWISNEAFTNLTLNLQPTRNANILAGILTMYSTLIKRKFEAAYDTIRQTITETMQQALIENNVALIASCLHIYKLFIKQGVNIRSYGSLANIIQQTIAMLDYNLQKTILSIITILCEQEKFAPQDYIIIGHGAIQALQHTNAAVRLAGSNILALLLQYPTSRQTIQKSAAAALIHADPQEQLYGLMLYHEQYCSTGNIEISIPLITAAKRAIDNENVAIKSIGLDIIKYAKARISTLEESLRAKLNEIEYNAIKSPHEDISDWEFDSL